MEIYFKFMSQKDYVSISVNQPSISVSEFKQKVYELKYKGKNNSGLCFGNDFDITVINAQTNNSYDDNMLIPSHTRVVIKRVPGGRGCRFINTRAIVVPGSHIPNSSANCNKRSSVTNPDIGEEEAIPPKKNKIFPNSSTSAIATSSSVTNPDVEGEEEEVVAYKKKKIFPVELLCRLCKQPMKDAAFTRCCCYSFCDKCIRDHLILSGFKCVCGAKDMLNDYLIPNITVRRLINTMLQSGYTIPRSDVPIAQPLDIGKKKRKREGQF